MTTFTTSQARWAALTTRNPLASHSFIYSVLTTKIYCRPTCPSRLARRANIVFHDTAAAAAAAGFRACKRCRPDPGQSGGDPQRIAVENACKLIRGEKDEKWPVKRLALEVGLTESHFCRVFKKIEGCTVGEYRTRLLLQRSGTMDMSTEQPPCIGRNQVHASDIREPLSIHHVISNIQNSPWCRTDETTCLDLPRDWSGSNQVLLAEDDLLMFGENFQDFVGDGYDGWSTDGTGFDARENLFEFIKFDDLVADT